MRLPLFNKRNKGFTLIEMLMAITIMVIITSVVVLNRSKAGEGTVLKNDADLMSLNIRQAQVNSIAVKESSVGSGNFSSGYGIEFSANSPTSYISFIDTNSNGTYDGNPELLSTNTLTNGNTIVTGGLCYEQGSSGEICGQNKIDIKFIRPNTAPILYVNGNRSNSIQAVRIKLTSTSGLTRSVYVYTTGEVSVQ